MHEIKSSNICKEKKGVGGETAELDPPFHRDDAILKMHLEKESM